MMRAFLITAASLAVAAPALAAGPVDTQQPAPVTFAAPNPGTDWTGPSVGLQLGYGDVSTTGPSLNGEDVLYGARAYYDFDFGSYVLGAGVQYDRTDIDLGGVTTLDSVTRIGARAGIDFDNSWLYGTGGFARATTTAAAVGDSNGYFAGVGYEIFVADGITAGAEILYHQFEDFDLGGLEADATTASVGLNFRF